MADDPTRRYRWAIGGLAGDGRNSHLHRHHRRGLQLGHWETYISQTEDGEVTLLPTVGEEFSGSSLPANWASLTTWEPGGSGATVSGGSLHVSGVVANTVATFGPGRSLEFVATFGAATFQHLGFFDEKFEKAWAMFSTKDSQSQLYTRTNGELAQDTPVGAPGDYVGSPHRYRIQWEAGAVRYFIDGVPVHTDNTSIASNVNVGASDFNKAATLSVDWLHMSPYSTPGTFTSRVFDAGETVNWSAISWDEILPANTSIKISVRTGDTPAPDGTWSSFTPITTSGAKIPGSPLHAVQR